MKCMFCKGETVDEYTNYIADLGECIIVIRNVPTQVCAQCGEKSYSYRVSVRVQEIINQVRRIVSGIAEVTYTEAA
ncbi:MAG: type II toxin-antitoxin system MqsA family antitoxin [Firmicutes bacterium]|nr:type II toxin-antitoxin system MqsA family antitoxin [Bacillota bacterium]